MVRRLFARDNKMSATQKQDLNRKFATWYKDFFLAKQKANEEIPAELLNMAADVRAYRDNINLLGLKDYQVRLYFDMRAIYTHTFKYTSFSQGSALGRCPLRSSAHDYRTSTLIVYAGIATHDTAELACGDLRENHCR